MVTVGLVINTGIRCICVVTMVQLDTTSTTTLPAHTSALAFDHHSGSVPYGPLAIVVNQCSPITSTSDWWTWLEVIGLYGHYWDHTGICASLAHQSIHRNHTGWYHCGGPDHVLVLWRSPIPSSFSVTRYHTYRDYCTTSTTQALVVTSGCGTSPMHSLLVYIQHPCDVRLIGPLRKIWLTWWLVLADHANTYFDIWMHHAQIWWNRGYY